MCTICLSQQTIQKCCSLYCSNITKDSAILHLRLMTYFLKKSKIKLFGNKNNLYRMLNPSKHIFWQRVYVYWMLLKQKLQYMENNTLSKNSALQRQVPTNGRPIYSSDCCTLLMLKSYFQPLPLVHALAHCTGTHVDVFRLPCLRVKPN